MRHTELMSRRSFLRSGAVALGVATGIGYVENHSEFTRTLLPTRIIEVDQDGHRYKFILTVHGIDFLNLATNPIDTTEFTHNLTVVDTQSPYLNMHDGSSVALGDIQLVADQSSNKFFKSAYYNNLLRGTDVALTDVVFNPTAVAVFSAHPALQTAVSARLVKHFEHQLQADTVSRRRLLQLGFAASTAGLVHALTGVFQRLSIAFDLNQEWTEPLAELNHQLSDLHRYDPITYMRDMVNAIKILDLKQDTNVVFGKGHWAMPYHLQEGKDQLLAELESLGPVLKLFTAATTNPEYLYNSMLFKNMDNRVQFHKITHPHLKALFAS